MEAQPIHRRSFGREFSDVAAAERWLDGIAAQARWPEKAAFAMQVCLEEIFVNILLHSTSSVRSEVDVTIAPHSNRVCMTIEDEGPPFDISQAPAHRITQPLDDIEPGGLGVVLVKTFANRISYRREGVRNCVHLEFVL